MNHRDFTRTKLSTDDLAAQVQFEVQTSMKVRQTGTMAFDRPNFLADDIHIYWQPYDLMTA